VRYNSWMVSEAPYFMTEPLLVAGPSISFFTQIRASGMAGVGYRLLMDNLAWSKSNFGILASHFHVAQPSLRTRCKTWENICPERGISIPGNVQVLIWRVRNRGLVLLKRSDCPSSRLPSHHLKQSGGKRRRLVGTHILEGKWISLLGFFPKL